MLEEGQEVRFEGTGDGAVYLNLKKQLAALPDVSSTLTDLEAATEYGLSDRNYHKQRETQDWANEKYTRALSRGDIQPSLTLWMKRSKRRTFTGIATLTATGC